MVAGTAFAQEVPDKSGEQKRADELFEEGRALLVQGDHNAPAACEKFGEAIQLDPEAPGTMLNLGLCNEKLGKYASALFWFRRAQARAAETNLPDYEAAAKEHTVDLAAKVATIKITFSSPPPADTKVKIDGREIPPADYLSAEVDPGPHTLVVGASGYRIFTQEFTIEGRGGQTIDVTLVQGDNTIIVDRGAGQRRAAIFTAAGGGALLLTSLAVTLYARNAYGKCANNGQLMSDLADCPHSDPGEATSYANKYSDIAKWWGTGFFVAGAVTVGIASALYFTAPAKERIDRTVFTPTVGPDQVGFAISGGF